MKSGQIRTIFINRDTGAIIGEASNSNPPAQPLNEQTTKALRPQSQGQQLQNSAPIPSTLSYNTDITAFTDVFSIDVELAPDELFQVRSHDFVEFKVVMDNPLPTLALDRIEGTDLWQHQIGVGFLEKRNGKTSAARASLQANGRDLFGQFMFAPFAKSGPLGTMKLKSFVNLATTGSYLENYLSLRGGNLAKIRDLGSFSGRMLFRTDLEQKKGALIQQYADLAINLVYMNRLGQVEMLGKSGTDGSTAPNFVQTPVGVLRKGLNIDDLSVNQDFTQVFSSVVVFWSSSQAEQDRITLPTDTFKNTDPRVSHVDQPGYRTFNASELADMAGSVSGSNRRRDVAKNMLNKSNRNLNSVVVQVSDPYFTNSGGFQIPWEVGQVWTIQSNEPEFTSRAQPNGTDSVEMTLAGINYQQNPNEQNFQLKFLEKETIL